MSVPSVPDDPADLSPPAGTTPRPQSTPTGSHCTSPRDPSKAARLPPALAYSGGSQGARGITSPPVVTIAPTPSHRPYLDSRKVSSGVRETERNADGKRERESEREGERDHIDRQIGGREGRQR